MENKMNINDMNYVLAGDYYIPDLKLPDEERTIGKYGRMHRDYLEEHHPLRFNHLVLEGQLWTYLADLNEQAQIRLQTIINQMKKAESVTEELKENNQWLWSPAFYMRKIEFPVTAKISAKIQKRLIFLPIM